MFSTLFFFFSSRRRHTRSLRDWSSDVCSSDLPYEPEPGFTYVNRCCTEENAEQYSKRGRLWSRRHQRDHWSRSRSEERRVGKECRSRWSPSPYKKTTEKKWVGAPKPMNANRQR